MIINNTYNYYVWSSPVYFEHNIRTNVDADTSDKEHLEIHLKSAIQSGCYPRNDHMTVWNLSDAICYCQPYFEPCVASVWIWSHQPSRQHA